MGKFFADGKSAAIGLTALTAVISVSCGIPACRVNAVVL